ncbi:MAG: cobyric acid synthase [Rhodoferax sp.]
MTATCIMVLGTTSGAGKSWLATALCRHYARQGFKVAPFKAQNMSNNARVVASDDGLGEIGSAQYFQALAARAVPDVRMNPLLLKPEADTHSQVVLLGQVSASLTAMAWRERSSHVWPHIAAALDALRAENDVVVIEGAGSPAEINLSDSDIVNMRVALYGNAACLLVTDIDRGGAFAHLYGTWALLPEPERCLIKGFVLNKFRGDAALLAPAPQRLQELTGIPTVAVLPMWWQHGLPEEDGMYPLQAALPAPGGLPITIAVIAWPRISNLDEFQPLKNIPGVRLLWVRSPTELAGLQADDWIILPGSKATASDLAWLRTQRLDAAVLAHADSGGAVLGICGGLQMLGSALIDPHGVDGNAPGLGLLPLCTLFEPDKTVQYSQATFAACIAAPALLPVTDMVHGEVDVANPWQALAGITVTGYEIHHGLTEADPALARASASARVVLPNGLGWQNAAGNVLGLYLHGLFEDPAALQALFARRLSGPVPTLDSVFDGLADFIERHIEPEVLAGLLA